VKCVTDIPHHIRDAENEKEFHEIHSLLRRGDIVGVTGTPSRTKKSRCRFLYRISWSVNPPSVALGSMCKQGERRVILEGEIDNSPFLVIMHNDVRNIFITRSKIVNYVRKYLDSMGFMEVSSCLCRIFYIR
jgi:lysyl-tRNA synthetase class 2